MTTYNGKQIETKEALLFNFSLTKLKLKNPAIWLAESIVTFNHAHLKLHDQSVALIDMKLHAQNQLYTSITFWDIKVLKASFGMPGHAWPHPPKLT